MSATMPLNQIDMGSSTQIQNFASGLPRWCMFLGMFLLIYGARLCLINAFGNGTPFLDEWTDQGSIDASYMAGTLSPMQLFAANNEHRQVLTHLLCLFLFALNKQWDPVLQMVVQALIYAGSLLLFVSLVGKQMSSLGQVALTGFATCLGIMPFGWKNTLWGIMSCFYFLIILGVAVIWICWRYEAFTWQWWLGALLALASLVTMAGGVFCVVAVTGFLALRSICERGRQWKKRLGGIAVLGIIVAAGLVSTPLHAVDSYVAKSFKDFLWALSGILSWPCGVHWACVIIQAPIIALTLVAIFRKFPLTDVRWFIIIEAASLWMQAVVVAYKRFGIWDASKYMDFWGMLLLANCASLYFLYQGLNPRRRYLTYPFAALWFALCVYGAADQAVNILPGQIEDFHTDQLVKENNTRQYLGTGNAIYLQGKIPFETPDLMRQMLGSATVRRVLPSSLTGTNAPLTPSRRTGNGFALNGYPAGAPLLSKPVYGSFSDVKSKSVMTLNFKAPRGAREVDLQIAGYPNARGMTLKVDERHGKSFDIVPPVDPGNNWQTVSVTLDRKSSGFKITAKDQSDGTWFAFSMPSVSNGGSAGRLARLLARKFFCFIDIGLVLLVLGALGSLAPVREPPDIASA